MQRRRCGMRDQRRRATSDPTIIAHRPNDRVDVQSARRRGGAFASASPPPVLSCPRFRCTSSPCSAERYAPRTESLWNVHQPRRVDRRARPTSCSYQPRVDQVSDGENSRGLLSRRNLESPLIPTESDESRDNLGGTSWSDIVTEYV